MDGALNHTFSGFSTSLGMLGGRSDAACSITGGINSAYRKASVLWASCCRNNWFSYSYFAEEHRGRRTRQFWSMHLLQKLFGQLPCRTEAVLLDDL